MFASGILSLNMINSNMKNLKKHNFKQKPLGKFVFHKTKKWTVCDVNCKSFDKCKCFVSEILLSNMLNSNVKKLKKQDFKQKSLRKFTFRETEKRTVCEFNRESLYNRFGENHLECKTKFYQMFINIKQK